MKKFFIIALLAVDAHAFKFLSNFKASSLIPRPSQMIKRKQAAKKYGDKKIAIITGASSGVGLKTAEELLRTGEYHVFGVTRNMKKMRTAAKDEDFPDEDFTPIKAKLDSFESVRSFCKELDQLKLNRPIDRLICNAAVYNPGEEAEWTTDGHEQTMQVNFLSHFLMVSLLLPSLTRSSDPRVIMVGSSSAEETVGVYPVADLSTLAGFENGFKQPVSMIDGLNYLGSKAYKDSKLCGTMLSNVLHDRYHRQTGIAFSTMYPGAVEGSRMFEGKPALDSVRIMPSFMSTVPAEPVSVEEAGQRLFQVAHDPRCSKSGIYWSWRQGGYVEEADEQEVELATGWGSIYENEPSDKVLDKGVAQQLWKYSSQLTGASWPPANQPRSPCPTLVVVGAVTKAMNAKEEAKRMKPGVGVVAGSAGYVVDAVAGNTVGLVAKTLQDTLLGGLPVDAKEGTFQQTVEDKKKKGLGQLVGRKGKGSEEPPEEPSEAVLLEKLDTVLDGGMPLEASKTPVA
jgi:protochlorophyllide reductase